LSGVYDVEPGVLEVAPTTDPLALILAAYETTREKEARYWCSCRPNHGPVDSEVA